MLAAAMTAAGGGGRRAEAADSEPPSKAFSLPQLVADQAKADEEWREFFRVKALSLGVYALKKGAADTQSPHKQDEIYIVMTGTGRFVTGAESRPFGPGDMLFVAAGVPHRFEDFSDDLVLWVVFWGPDGGEVRT
jgi:mannose-6-phosphate isomerase-like protein (cupin superfamily)